MKIVRIKSGLGNQMFQYAFYRKLMQTYDDVRLDLEYINQKSDHNGYELFKIFNIQENRADINKINEYADDGLDLFSKVRKKIGLRKKTHVLCNNNLYDEKFLHMDNVLLDGYWQNYRYLHGIEDVLQKEFEFKEKLDEKNEQIANYMENSCSISVHVRRGDYLLPIYMDKFCGICDENYYKSAIAYMKNINSESKFFVFSDDIDWAKKQFVGNEFTFIDWNTGNKSYIDMILMSKCKNNIIANSTFSWWGAWLNKNLNKIVIAPKLWNNDEKDYTDIVLEDWVKL